MAQHPPVKRGPCPNALIKPAMTMGSGPRSPVSHTCALASGGAATALTARNCECPTTRMRASDSATAVASFTDRSHIAFHPQLSPAPGSDAVRELKQHPAGPRSRSETSQTAEQLILVASDAWVEARADRVAARLCAEPLDPSDSNGPRYRDFLADFRKGNNAATSSGFTEEARTDLSFILPRLNSDRRWQKRRFGPSATSCSGSSSRCSCSCWASRSPLREPRRPGAVRS